MKRLRSSHELIFHRLLLLVGQQRAVLVDRLLAQFFKPGLHKIGGSLRVHVVDGEFVKPSSQETALHPAGLTIWKKALSRLNFDNSQCGLISGHRNRKIQGMFGCPSYQFFRRVSPVLTKGRLKNGLRPRTSHGNYQEKRDVQTDHKAPGHAPILSLAKGFRKRGSFACGYLLVEAMMTMSILTVLGLVLLKLSINILHPRQWTLQQSISDAYMTYERSFAERVPFDTLTANVIWPTYPATATTNNVRLGALPGGGAITGTVYRTKTAQVIADNPASMQVWQVQSVLTYVVGNRTYVKSRTVIRSQ